MHKLHSNFINFVKLATPCMLATMCSVKVFQFKNQLPRSSSMRASNSRLISIHGVRETGTIYGEIDLNENPKWSREQHTVRLMAKSNSFALHCAVGNHQLQTCAHFPECERWMRLTTSSSIGVTHPEIDLQR